MILTYCVGGVPYIADLTVPTGADMSTSFKLNIKHISMNSLTNSTFRRDR